MMKKAVKALIILFFLLIVSLFIIFIVEFRQVLSKQPQTDLKQVSTPQIVTNPNEPSSKADQHYIVPPLTYSKMPYYSDKSVIFVGMVSNAQSTIPRILEQLNEVACVFNNSFFLFFESNSRDKTPQILQDWATNSTLKANDGNKMEYCHKLDNSAYSYPHTIDKKVLFGDELVQSELDEYVEARSNATYIHNLSRVEKFVPYRNMLLRQLYAIDADDVDYMFMIDLDVWEIDFFAFFSELKECPHDIMCVNGLEWFGYYRDSFASVGLSHIIFCNALSS